MYTCSSSCSLYDAPIMASSVGIGVKTLSSTSALRRIEARSMLATIAEAELSTPMAASPCTWSP